MTRYMPKCMSGIGHLNLKRQGTKDVGKLKPDILPTWVCFRRGDTNG
ncbi:MAG: hypothetical protein UU80_C0011G0026 [candidate division WWE3 bacterium GW2011_GWA1_41_8]|uniref:Uncharacterized protein n=2 Tax=Katanobacteria TaxID=422282 RepID=A0A0G0XBE6_UNCKA|nr:MAG: hypothetical protein UU72_C0014G0017 [candidate division WWE3 bacterium GW2011_GWB1_41_6]KKS22220.1 MAG: hypothetical protein UU80_C0011G0026 [candidate division WWE3 bacterium GW2011_GWA1_41_8]